jgi:TPR repeat protein
MRRLDVCTLGFVATLVTAPIGAQVLDRSVDRDGERASVTAAHYRLAAERGSALGMCRLGDLFLVGHGVERSAVEAYRWYLAAVHATAAGDSIPAAAAGLAAEERKQCDRNRKHAASLLTRSERVDADRSARAWLDAVLGVRARE